MYATGPHRTQYTPAAANPMPDSRPNTANRTAPGDYDEDALGKFPMLDGLIRHGTLRPNLQYLDPVIIDSGDIVYISDGGPLNQRVMLVGLINRRLMQCYPIERTNTSTQNRHHWNLRQDLPSREEPIRRGPSLYATFTNNMTIANNLTVNLDDPHDVGFLQRRFKILGSAEDESFDAAIEEIRALMNADLDSMKRSAPRTSIPTPQPSVSPRPPPIVHNPPPQSPQSPSPAPPSESIDPGGSQDVVVPMGRNVIRKNGALFETRKRETKYHPFGKKAQKKL